MSSTPRAQEGLPVITVVSEDRRDHYTVNANVDGVEPMTSPTSGDRVFQPASVVITWCRVGVGGWRFEEASVAGPTLDERLHGTWADVRYWDHRPLATAPAWIQDMVTDHAPDTDTDGASDEDADIEIQKPRVFSLRRTEDVSGTSGTGLVAYGTRYPPDGVTTLHWTTEFRSSTVFPSVDELVNIHGHGGRTEVHWEDHVEHGILMSGGGMNVRPSDPAFEERFPVGEWVKAQIDMGHRVYRRRVYVVEDWEEVEEP